MEDYYSRKLQERADYENGRYESEDESPSIAGRMRKPFKELKASADKEALRVAKSQQDMISNFFKEKK